MCFIIMINRIVLLAGAPNRKWCSDFWSRNQLFAVFKRLTRNASPR